MKPHHGWISFTLCCVKEADWIVHSVIHYMRRSGTDTTKSSVTGRKWVFHQKRGVGVVPCTVGGSLSFVISVCWDVVDTLWPPSFCHSVPLFVPRWIYLNDQNLCIPASSSFVYGAVPIGASIYVIGDLDTGQNVTVILSEPFPGDSEARCVTSAYSHGAGTNYDYVREFKRSTGTWHHTKPLLPSDLRRTGCAALRIANCKLFRLQLQQGLFRIRVHSPWRGRGAEAELLTKRAGTRRSARGQRWQATLALRRPLCGNASGFVMLRSLGFQLLFGRTRNCWKKNEEESVPPGDAPLDQAG